MSKKQRFCAESLSTEKMRILHNKNTFYEYFCLNTSVPMDHRSIVLVTSCLFHQDTSNDTHDNPNGPIQQFDPGHGQGHHTPWTCICQVWANTAKVVVLPECCQFSEKKLQIVA